MTNPTSSEARLPAPAELMERARAATSLNDFGGGDFIEGLDRFWEGLVREARLSDGGLLEQVGLIERRLANRLQIERWFEENPHTANSVVDAPVTITGLPRTGTTALVNMMSQDKRFRLLRSWEQAQPCPPPRAGDDDDPRRQAALAVKDRLARERPDLMAMHLYDPDATDEDVEILGLSFHSQQLVLPIYAYHAWWRDADLRDTFLYHRRVMQLLQSQCPPSRWLFKAPAHSYHMEAFFHAYPGARVIVTHRDPGKAIPSSVSFVGALQEGRAFADPVAAGRHLADHLRIGTERLMEARSRIGEDSFCDVHHEEFLADPFGTIERIYDFIGWDLPPAVRARMQEWQAKNRSGAHGAHRYQAEQFGLRAEDIRIDCAKYIARYGIAVEI